MSGIFCDDSGQDWSDDVRSIQSAPTERTALIKRPSLSNDAKEILAGDGCGKPTAGNIPLLRVALIMGAAWFGCLIAAIDSTIMATLAGPISSEFKSLSLLSWLTTAYFVASATVQPISGRLTDIFGRGPGLVLSNVVFAVGNLICAMATNQYVMIFGRVVAGAGGGGLLSISTFLGSDLIPLRQRGVAQGIGQLCYATGSMLGGIMGGLFNDHIGWRIAFYVQVPPAIFCAFAIYFLVKAPPKKESDTSYLKRIDFVGVFLIASFLILLLLGLSAGGNIVPWSHPLPITTIPVSLFFLAGFIKWESTMAEPVIPVKLMLNRTVFSGCATNLLATVPFMAGILYLPLYLQVRGSSATDAGLQLSPSPFGIAVGSLGAGYIVKRTGKYVGLGILSQVVLTSGTLLLNLLSSQSPNWLLSGAFILVSFGAGSMSTITLIACTAALDHSDHAVVTSAICK